MLAFVCIWLAVYRIYEQWEDARVLGTQLESARSSDNATFAIGLPIVQALGYSV